MESGNIRSRWRNFSFFTPDKFFPVPIVLGEKGEGCGELTGVGILQTCEEKTRRTRRESGQGSF
jgi:hypothetical protein